MPPEFARFERRFEALRPDLPAGAAIGAQRDTRHRRLAESSVYAEAAPAPSRMRVQEHNSASPQSQTNAETKPREQTPPRRWSGVPGTPLHAGKTLVVIMVGFPGRHLDLLFRLPQQLLGVSRMATHVVLVGVLRHVQGANGLVDEAVCGGQVRVP